MNRFRLGCDIGGTFTDFALLDEATGALHPLKVLSTPDDPSRAVLEGLHGIAERDPRVREELGQLLHATTLAINAVLERRGAPTAVLATQGFRDVLEMRRSRRADVADIFGDPPEPLVPRERRAEIAERIWSDGRILTELDVEAARETVEGLVAEGVQSFAVTLLHSYANKDHEQALAGLIREVAPGAYVSLSSEVLPEAGEYERTSSTVVNAYVQPVMDRYLTRLRDGMDARGFHQPMQLMLSGGGLAAPETAKTFPARMIESGAAAGVMAGEYVRNELGIGSVLIFDMGGTTAKITIVQGGHIPITSELEVGRAYRFRKGTGLPVNVPSVEILEIGAGGGSIAFLNETGSLQIGPRSAGAMPGPICYGRGGTEPTVTDAALVLGYLDPGYFLGGGMSLDVEAARAGIETHIAGPLGISVDEAAWGIHEIVCENMAGAARTYIAEWGGDPSQISLVAFGGAGPIHAYNLARKLGVSQIVLPKNPGILSAVGLLTAPNAYDLARSYRAPLAEVEPGAIEAAFAEMEATARQVLRETGATGEPAVRRTVEMCYVGQELALPVALDGPATAEALREAYFAAYEARFGYAYRNLAVGLVRLRLRAEIPGRSLGEEPARQGPSVQHGSRRVFCPDRRAWADYPVFRRPDLAGNHRSDAASVIEDDGSTFIAGPGAEVVSAPKGNLVIRFRETADAAA